LAREASRLVAVAAAAFVAPSSAVASRFGSTVTIHFTNAAGGAAFYGVVKSGKRACWRHRAVNLQQSASRDSGYSTIGSGNTTNRDHTWGYAPDPFSAGWYRAVAPPKQLAKGICRKAKSPPLGIF
jgi:hypothetical protein